MRAVALPSGWSRRTLLRARMLLMRLVVEGSLVEDGFCGGVGLIHITNDELGCLKAGASLGRNDIAAEGWQCVLHH